MFVETLNKTDFVDEPSVARTSQQDGGVTSLNTKDTRWQACSAHFPNASVDQLPPFAETRWGQKRISFCSVERDGETIGGATVATFKLPLVRRGVSYIKYGPLWRRGDRADFSNYKIVVEKLIDTYGRNQGNAIVIVPRACPDTLEQEVASLAELDFAPSGQNRDPNRYLVNAALSEDEQLRSLGSKWRYNLRKGLAQDHDIVVSDDVAHFSAFKQLHAEMSSRKTFVNTDPIDALPLLAAGPQNIRPIYFMVRSGGELIAGATVIICGDIAFYVFGASNVRALSQNAGYVLQWSVLKYLRERQVPWYDLGGEAGSQGLRQFKTGLTGKSGVILKTPGEMKFCADAGAALAYKSVNVVRDGVRRVRTLLKE